MKDEREVYEINEDTVDNFDQLNEKYRTTWDWIGKDLEENEDIVKENLDPIKVFKNLYLPSDESKY